MVYFLLIYLFFILGLCEVGELFLVINLEFEMREILNQSPPIREILSDYQLNLMSFVKIQSSQTNEIQCPPLSSLPPLMHLP